MKIFLIFLILIKNLTSKPYYISYIFDGRQHSKCFNPCEQRADDCYTPIEITKNEDNSVNMTSKCNEKVTRSIKYIGQDEYGLEGQLAALSNKQIADEKKSVAEFNSSYDFTNILCLLILLMKERLLNLN